jgi:hypothetical protein
MQEEIFDETDGKEFLADTSLSGKATLRSEMAQEIISRQPGFLENWSLLVFLGLLLLLFGGTWFVSYPDVITARAMIVAENGPRELFVKHEGHLIKYFVQNDQQVKPNDTIAWIESPAEAKEIITAPITGKISLNSIMKENVSLRSGTSIGYITPVNSNYYAEVILPQNNLGKLHAGLPVQLRLDAYPYEEWGFLDGQIIYIANSSSESGFVATIKLTNNLITNNNKKLSYKNGLRAQAVIITNNTRLLQRFYYGFVKSTSVEK